MDSLIDAMQAVLRKCHHATYASN